MKGKTMKALINKLSQPSTYAGFAGLALVLGYTSPQIAAVTSAAAAAFALVAIVVNEGGADA
jgi:hypothetical protein